MYTFVNTPLPDGVARRSVGSQRFTTVEFANNQGSMEIRDDSRARQCANRSLKARWTGTTEFAIAEAQSREPSSDYASKLDIQLGGAIPSEILMGCGES